MKKQQQNTLLAIDPTVRGFGYVVFESEGRPIDWGKMTIRLNKNWRCRKHIQRIIKLHSPDAVILETIEPSLRRSRVRSLIRGITADMNKQTIPVYSYTREQILNVFASFGARSKHSIARRIAEWFPELKPMLPKRRKFYEPEDERYGIFDAAALILVHLYLAE